MIRDWLHCLLKSSRPMARHPRSLQVEALEERVVPTTIRTITYNQITSLPTSTALNGNAPDNVLSANGNKAVFSAGPSATQVYTVNSDGSGLTEVDPNGSPNLDISANGSEVLESIQHGNVSFEYRIVNADGTNMHDAFVGGGLEEFNIGRLSADGSTVFFTADAPFSVTGQTQPDVPGLYAVAASGASLPQLIVSETQVATVLGSSVGAVDFGNSAADLALGVSSDGTKLVFCVGTANDGAVEFGVNSNGTGLHPFGSITPATAVGMDAAGISGDGTKVFTYTQTNADGHSAAYTVYNFDGSDPVTLTNLPNDFGISNGPEHLELSQDGSKLLLGSTGYLVNTDNSGMVQIGTDAGFSLLGNRNANLPHATMNSSATEFLYVLSDSNTNGQQLAVAQLNPSSLGVDPAISNVTISPPFIVIAPGSPSTTTISAQVSPTAVSDVGDALLYNGISSNNLNVNGMTADAFADQQLFDDGTHGDMTAGNGIFTNNGIGTEGTVAGPRTVRVLAENLDSSGLLHATAVESDGLTEVTSAPLASLQFSAPTYSIADNGVTATITVTRTVNTSSAATVNYATSNGTAVAGTDYTAASGTLTFAANQTSQTFTIPILDNPNAAPAATVNLTLSAPSSGASLGSQSSAVLTITAPLTIHTITYNQITSLPSSTAFNANAPDNILSADGNKAVFSAGSGGNQVYTVNSDGSGLTLVDPNGSAVDDISANGSVVLETIGHGDAGVEYRIVNSDGTNMHDAFTAANLEEFANGRLSADGSTVYFTADAPFPITGQAQPDQPGLYMVAASGASQPQLIVSEAQLATLLGSSVGAVDIGSTAADLGLGISSDGTKLVFCAGTTNDGDVEFGVNSNGTGLHPFGSITPATAVGMDAAGISGDGTKVFTYTQTDADGHTAAYTVYNFDGSNPVTLTNLPNDFGISNGAEHLELTQNGSELLLGTTSYLVNTDNSGFVQIGTDAGFSTIANRNANLYHATMNSAGTEFLYTLTTPSDGSQLAIAQLNPTSLGVDPAVSNVTISPPYILLVPGQFASPTTISAQVNPTTVKDVGDALLYNGISSNNLSVNGMTVDSFADQQLFDDGTHGDLTAGNGIFTNNGIGTEGTVTGPRMVRVLAESLDSSGLLHATAVQVGGLSVVNQVPQTAIKPVSPNPQTADVNTAFASPLVATVTDASGNPVSGVVVTFAAPASGASVTFSGGNTATTNAQGQASKSVTANGTSGSYTVTASAAGVAAPANFTLTNEIATVTSITSLTSTTPNGTYDAGTALQLKQAAPTINLTITFSAPVTLAGGNLTATLSNGAKVTIAPFTNSTTATGTYTVAQTDPDAIPLDTTSLSLAAGATLKDADGNPVALTFTAAQSLKATSTISVKNFNFQKLGAYRPSDGSWSLDSDGTTGFGPNDQVFFSFSAPGLIGVVGDWTGTGRDNIGDFNPATGVWQLDLNGDGKVESNETFTFGQAGDQPVVGDWDGNPSGRDELGVFRGTGDAANSGEFILDINNDKTIDTGDKTFTFGLATDHVIVGDWTGSGITKVGVYRDAKNFNPADAGDIVFSENTSDTDTTVFTSFVFGLITDHVVIGDWNGSGTAKVAVYRDGSSVTDTTSPFYAPGTALFSEDFNGDLDFSKDGKIFLFGLSTDQFVAGNWVVTPPLQPSMQLSANGEGPGAAPLTQADLNTAETQAINLWADAGLDAASLAKLRNATVSLGTLDAGQLGETESDQITLDATAAGWGWSTSGTPEAGQMDLDTVLAHEMGHVLGLPDQTTQPTDLMYEWLATGQRKAPTTQDVDALFANL